MGEHSFAYIFERFPSFVQTFVYREAAEMVRQGAAPLLVSMRPPEDPVPLPELEHLILQMPPAAEIRKILKLPMLLRWRTPKHLRERDINRLFEALWLGAVLKKHGITHVHAHFAGMAARVAWWLKHIYGFTYSFTGHANDIFCDNDYPVSNAQLVAGARLVVTETDYACQWMRQKYPEHADKMRRVYNGIDSDFPPRTAAAANGKMPRVVSVGRYVEKKGFSDLIEACRLIAAAGKQFECAIVGGGPLEEVLSAQIREAGLQDCVHLLGPKPQTEVRQLIAEADVFVLACVPEADGGSDNLPTVIMEAMMTGVPVVSTALAGVPEMIEDGKSGILVPPRSPKKLAEAISGLLADTDRAAKYGEAGLAVARERFGLGKTTGELRGYLREKCGVGG